RSPERRDDRERAGRAAAANPHREFGGSPAGSLNEHAPTLRVQSAATGGRFAREAYIMQTASFAMPCAFACGILATTLWPVSTPPARAAEFFVNNSNAACSNTGPGTADAPYCTITAALAAHHEPGTILTVMPGIYREQVTFPASGLSGSPL